MKFLRICFYVIRQSAKNIARNFFMIFASVVVVFFVLLVAGAFIETGLTLGNAIEQYSDRADVEINFKTYVTEETANEYLRYIAADSRVKEVKYISRDENIERIIEFFDEYRDIYEGYRDSELLGFISLEVQLKTYSDRESFVSEIEAEPDVDNVQNIVETIEKMELVRFWVNIATITASVVMTALSLLLIFNTVKLTVIARKKEIEIMKYIGATDVYIATPFVIEGVTTGLLGALIAFLSLWGIYNGVYSFLKDLLADSKIVPMTFAESGGGVILLFFLLFGAVTGFIASVFAAKKHMKV